MSTSKRKMYRKQCKQLQLFDKRPNARFGFKLSLLSNYSAIRRVRFVKTCENILQNTFFLPPFLAIITTQKHPISPYFQPFMFYFYAIFEYIICIQHHFAFLVGRLPANFRCPKTDFQQSKYHFLQCFYPLITSVFHQSQTNKPNMQCASLYISPCVLLHFVLRLAAFYTAFCCILPCIQRHLALHFAANCNAICSKQHYFCCQLPTILYNYRFYAMFIQLSPLTN